MFKKQDIKMGSAGRRQTLKAVLLLFLLFPCRQVFAVSSRYTISLGGEAGMIKKSQDADPNRADVWAGYFRSGTPQKVAVAGFSHGDLVTVKGWDEGAFLYKREGRYILIFNNRNLVDSKFSYIKHIENQMSVNEFLLFLGTKIEGNKALFMATKQGAVHEILAEGERVLGKKIVKITDSFAALASESWQAEIEFSDGTKSTIKGDRNFRCASQNWSPCKKPLRIKAYLGSYGSASDSVCSLVNVAANILSECGYVGEDQIKATVLKAQKLEKGELSGIDFFQDLHYSARYDQRVVNADNSFNGKLVGRVLGDLQKSLSALLCTGAKPVLMLDDGENKHSVAILDTGFGAAKGKEVQSQIYGYDAITGSDVSVRERFSKFKVIGIFYSVMPSKLLELTSDFDGRFLITDPLGRKLSVPPSAGNDPVIPYAHWHSNEPLNCQCEDEGGKDSGHQKNPIDRDRDPAESQEIIGWYVSITDPIPGKYTVQVEPNTDLKGDEINVSVSLGDSPQSQNLREVHLPGLSQKAPFSRSMFSFVVPSWAREESYILDSLALVSRDFSETSRLIEADVKVGTIKDLRGPIRFKIGIWFDSSLKIQQLEEFRENGLLGYRLKPGHQGLQSAKIYSNGTVKFSFLASKKYASKLEGQQLVLVRIDNRIYRGYATVIEKLADK